MIEKQNLESQSLWGNDIIPDISTVFRSCLGYANCPGWAFVRRSVEDHFADLKGLQTIELGCGEGKVSLLFSLLGAKTTLVDYSPKQLNRARYIAEKFTVQPVIIEENLLQLPKSFWGRYDISMSFGTAEHFFGKNRQTIFDVHSKVLRKGGLSILWVPNRYGILFHLGVIIRRLFHRKVCLVDETPFTRRELFRRAKVAGLTDIKIVGGELLRNDFNNFCLNVRRLIRPPISNKNFAYVRNAKSELLQSLIQNNAPIRPWNNYFSYPLILIGTNI